MTALPHHSTMLDLYAASATLKAAHEGLIDHAEIAALVHAASANIMTALGLIVIAHSKARQAGEVTP